MFTTAAKFAAEREGPDGAICDEGIAVAIAKEQSAPDGSLAAGRKSAPVVNMAKEFVATIRLTIVPVCVPPILLGIY